MRQVSQIIQTHRPKRRKIDRSYVPAIGQTVQSHEKHCVPNVEPEHDLKLSSATEQLLSTQPAQNQGQEPESAANQANQRSGAAEIERWYCGTKLH